MELFMGTSDGLFMGLIMGLFMGLIMGQLGCYVGGAWVNSSSYADDMVLLAPTVTALHTLLEVCRVYAGPHDNVYNRTKPV